MDDLVTISSRDNAQIKEAAKLMASSSYRKETGLFILEGTRLCQDAAACGVTIEKVFYTEELASKNVELLAGLKKLTDEQYIIASHLAEKISDTKTPQGLFCICKMGEEALSLPKADAKYLLLEDIADPGNLGSTVRTAEALGIDQMILSPGCCDRYNPKALRASMGSLIRMPAEILPIGEALSRLRKDGYKTYGSVVERSAAAITKCDFSGKTAMVIGSEARGISDTVKAAVDKLITIPMGGRAESLNAAAAASIILWEMVRPR